MQTLYCLLNGELYVRTVKVRATIMSVIIKRLCYGFLCLDELVKLSNYVYVHFLYIKYYYILQFKTTLLLRPRPRSRRRRKIRLHSTTFETLKFFLPHIQKNTIRNKITIATTLPWSQSSTITITTVK